MKIKSEGLARSIERASRVAVLARPGVSSYRISFDTADKREREREKALDTCIDKPVPFSSCRSRFGYREITVGSRFFETEERKVSAVSLPIFIPSDRQVRSITLWMFRF